MTPAQAPETSEVGVVADQLAAMLERERGEEGIRHEIAGGAALSA